MLHQSMGGMLYIPQWFVWRLKWNADENKYDKVPCYPDGSPYRMDAQEPANWMTYDQACTSLAWHRSRSDGFTYTLGFMLTASTGYWFLDIDKCVSNAQLSKLATDLCASFPGAAWEWSSSGNGLHIFGRGVIPKHRMKDRFKPRLNLEFYSDKRGIAFGLTGDMWGNADTDHSGAVEWLVNNYFPAQAMDGEILDSQFDLPDPAWNGPTDDTELIERMKRVRRHSAAEVFGGIPDQRASFAQLYEGDAATINDIYGNDESGAEFALIGMLAFWTGRDAPRIERLMRQSGLYREKWETGRGSETFIRYSILRLCRTHFAESRAVYGQPRPGAANVVAEDSGESDSGHNGIPSDAETRRMQIPERSVSIGNDASGSVTVAIDPAKWEASRHWVAAFNGAGTGEELETLARTAQTDPRMTSDLAFSLGRDVQKRFEELQIEKSISWCRTLLMPPKVSDGYNAVHPLTEIGNSFRMLDRYGADLMYVLQMDKWFKWDGVRWKYCYPTEMQHLATQTVLNLHSEMDGMDSTMQQAFYKFAIESQKTGMINAMVTHARANMAVVRDAKYLDADPNVIGVLNGAVDLRTGLLLAPDRNRFITSTCGTTYNPGAIAPWFLQTVSDCFYGDPEMIAFFKRLMGYTLLADPKEQLLIIPFGSGANGKSTVLVAIQKTLGEYARGVPSETFVSTQANVTGNAGGAREDLLRLRGARYVYISEIEEGSQLKESLVKTLTGGEKIIARGIHAKESVEFDPAFVPVMPTNHKPTIKGDDNGIWRRILLLPFMRNFSSDPYIVKDEHRADKLNNEREGILRWLVEGAIEYRTFGLCAPASVRAATADYREEMDYMKEWVDNYCEFDPSYRDTKADLFNSWKFFAEPRGLLRYMSSQNQLARRLQSDRVVPVKDVPGKRGRGFAGIRLKSQAAVKFS
jgi:P4 family phage/plasmid primase-like protien